MCAQSNQSSRADGSFLTALIYHLLHFAGILQFKPITIVIVHTHWWQPIQECLRYLKVPFSSNQYTYFLEKYSLEKLIK